MTPGRGRGSARRGIALPMVLVLVLLLEGFGALAAMATMAKVRLVGDDRLAVEGWLVASSAIAEVRGMHDGDLHGLADGRRLTYDWIARSDGWRWRADLVRSGELVRLVVTVERRGAGGELRASRRLTLLLEHLPSDTVQVLAHRARM